MIIPLDRPLPDGSSGLTRGRAKQAIAPLFDLAPDRVCRALAVASQAVGSYPTVSPLPIEAEAPTGGLFSVALSVDRRSRPGRLAVSQYLCLWSPDFPPARGVAASRQRSSVLRVGSPTRVSGFAPLDSHALLGRIELDGL